MAEGHKFSVVRRLRQRLLNRSKKRNFYTCPRAFGASGVDDPIGISYKDLLRHKIRVAWLSCGVVLRSFFSHFDIIPACDRQTDRQTDGYAMTANTALA